MKRTVRPIRQCLAGIRELPDRLSRARFFRGHGVHSPFVYALVREVFMQRCLLGDDRALYERLLAAGVPAVRALQLQNLYTRCAFRSCTVDAPGGDLTVLTPNYGAADTLAVVRQAAGDGTTVAILSPGESRERERLCREIVAAHPSTSVDNRGYLLVFNNHLPKQHFRL